MTSVSDLDLLDFQINAFFTHDALGRIIRINEPNGNLAPRFFLGRTRNGNLWRVRNDLDTKTMQDLAQLASEEPVANDLKSEPRNLKKYFILLDFEQKASVGTAGTAFSFPNEFASNSDRWQS